ncbi:MAG: cytochrome c biosis protein CcmG, thiol:disulfide interchange protein DsbE [Solirubrobacteraceae bacterium]|jgi:cytochrome c biogenesis protein CcmG/thiol:disulfide interchange protein DsbE|nr:cytochrome c biosis protein CcmG, thiol:disulfide interchange protein DsbE [Solirubrobacteraceae bacterium]
MRRGSVWTGLAIAFVGALILAEVVSGTGTPKAAQRRIAPALPATTLVAPAVTVAQLRGKPAIVHFWASWCGPCTVEAPELAHLAAALHGRARLVGVDWSDSHSGGAAFVAKHGWSFPNLEDPAGRTGGPWGITGLPSTFLLDVRGRIVARLTGPQTAAGLLGRLRSLSG